MVTSSCDCVIYSDCSMYFFTSGFVEFLNTELQTFENDSSVEVCIVGRSFGFVVNVSTVELTATGMLITC